jgi:hypothetical protein
VAKYVTKPGGYFELTREQWQCDDRREQGNERRHNRDHNRAFRGMIRTSLSRYQ